MNNFKKITKLNLSQIIYKKTFKVINQKLIENIIGIVFNYIVDEIKENRIVSINNFGTFSVSVSDNLYFSKDARNTLKFKPHVNFNKLWHIKKNRFRKSKKLKTKMTVRKL